MAMAPLEPLATRSGSERPNERLLHHTVPSCCLLEVLSAISRRLLRTGLSRQFFGLQFTARLVFFLLFLSSSSTDSRMELVCADELVVRRAELRVLASRGSSRAALSATVYRPRPSTRGSTHRLTGITGFQTTLFLLSLQTIVLYCSCKIDLSYSRKVPISAQRIYRKITYVADVLDMPNSRLFDKDENRYSHSTQSTQTAL